MRSLRTSAVALAVIAVGLCTAAEAGAATRIFYQLEGDVWSAAPNGANAERVVKNAEYPAISRDGRRLAYTAQGDVWVATASGEKTKRLRAPGAQHEPAWSPTGRRLVFRTGGNIEVMRRDGSKRRTLTNSATPGGDSQPDWSPDGSEIVFTRAGTTDESFDVMVIGAGGGEARPVVASECAEFNPRWSPSGDQIALFVGFGVTLCREDVRPGVYVVNADGSGYRQALDDTGETGLDWSPDGKRIVAGSYFDELVHGSAGGGAAATIPGTSNASSPAWGPAR